MAIISIPVPVSLRKFFFTYGGKKTAHSGRYG